MSDAVQQLAFICILLGKEYSVKEPLTFGEIFVMWMKGEDDSNKCMLFLFCE